MRIAMARTFITTSASAVLCISVAGCTEVTSSSRVDVIAQGASANLPQTSSNSIAVLPNSLCLVDSYEVRVLCADHSFESVRVIGGRGSGPGEYKGYLKITRGPANTLLVYDAGLDRITQFTTDGTVLLTTFIPALFDPIGFPDDTTLLGTFENFHRYGEYAAVAWVTLSANATPTNRTRTFAIELNDSTQRRGLSFGALLADGTLVFSYPDYRLAQFDTTGRLLRSFGPTRYEPQFRDEAEMRQYRTDMKRFGREPTDADVKEWASKPKPPIISDGIVAGPENTVWVGTSRRRDGQSFIDVFRDGEQIGEVSVRGKLQSLAILESKLAVLVELPELDEEELPIRRVEWFEIRIGD